MENSQQERKRPEELRDLYEKLSSKDRKIEEIRKENEELRNRITQARVDNVKARNFTVDELSEAQTRNKYIDVELQEAGWSIGKDCNIFLQYDPSIMFDQYNIGMFPYDSDFHRFFFIE